MLLRRLILALSCYMCAEGNDNSINLNDLLLQGKIDLRNFTAVIDHAQLENGILTFENLIVNGDKFDGSSLISDLGRNDLNSPEFIGSVIEYDALAQSVNTSIDPCQDFFSFVCSGFIEKHPIPGDKYRVTQTELLKEQVVEQLQAYMSETPSFMTREDRIVRTFFQRCLENINATSEGTMTMLFDELRRLTRCRSLTEWLMEVEPETAFFDVSVAPDEFNSQQNLITVQDKNQSFLSVLYMGEEDAFAGGINQSVSWISPTTSLMTFNTYFDPAYASEYVAMRQALYSVLTLLSEKDTFRQFFPPIPHILWSKVESLLLVDQAIAKINQENEFNTDSSTIPVWQLPMNFATVDWPRYLAHIAPESIRRNLLTRSVRIMQISTVRRIEELLTTIDDFTLVDYLQWKVIFHFAPFLGKSFNAVVEGYNQKLYGVEAEDQSKECVENAILSFPDVVSVAWIERHFNNDSGQVAKITVDTVRSAFLELLEENDWMDDKTKEQAKAKLNFSVSDSYYTMARSINLWMRGESFKKLDVKNRRDTFESAAMEVNAFYDPYQNAIAILAGILSPPFFNAKWPRILNLGGIGVVTGHEVTHGFDDYGAYFDLNGNRKNWWGRKTLENFENRQKCFVDQYERVDMEEVDVNIDGKRTAGENIADNGGMHAAINAMRKSQQDTPETFTIRGLENYTPEQYFFMNYAFVWCGKTRTQTLLSEMATDVHSPDKIRVNVVLANQPEFAQTFKCPVDSPMNPSKRCIIW